MCEWNVEGVSASGEDEEDIAGGTDTTSAVIETRPRHAAMAMQGRDIG
jgi:hypothetical protein